MEVTRVQSRTSVVRVIGSIVVALLALATLLLNPVFIETTSGRSFLPLSIAVDALALVTLLGLVWIARGGRIPFAESPTGQLLVRAAAAGITCGLALEALTYWMAGNGPAGQGWSFRGNGALVVPLGVGPALLAGGWTALVLHARGVTGWRILALAAALVGAAPTILSVLLLVTFGTRAQQISDLLTIPAFGWTLLAPLLAAFVPLHGSATTGRLNHLIGAAVFAVTLIGAFFNAELALPPGS